MLNYTSSLPGLILHVMWYLWYLNLSLCGGIVSYLNRKWCFVYWLLSIMCFLL